MMKRWSLFVVFLILWLAVILPLSAANSRAIAYIAFSEGYWQLWVMDEDGNQQTQVSRTPYDKVRLSWYPDGQHVLINGVQGDLNRINVISGEEMPIKLPLEAVADAVISPDGQHIAFSASVADAVDRNDIWLVDANGEHLRKLTRMLGLQHEPAWSHDSKSIYFLSGITGAAKQDHDLWRYELVSGSLIQLTSGKLYHFDIDVSNQGLLAYSNNSTGNYEIWTKNTAGEPIRRTNNPALDAKPSWSPDGESLLFESTRNGVPNIWKLNLKTGALKQLTDEKTGARQPGWYRQGGSK